jgi:peptide/nickel transport system substrate-binding protein
MSRALNDLTRREFIRRNLAAGGAAAAALLGPASAAFAAGAPGGGAPVVLTLFGLPTRLVGSTEVTAAYVLLLVHDVLARPDWNSGKPVPRLAERWSRSVDGRSYTVSLKPANFQDGRPVTAADVKFSYEFYLHPQFPLTEQALLEIEGAAAYKQGRASTVSGITVLDPQTVRFTLGRRYAFFVEGILGADIMPKHAWAGVDMSRMLEHPYAQRPVGAGPFRLTDWKQNDSMSFQAFSGYWNGRPSVDRAVVRWIPEPATLEAELRAGNVDASVILPDDFPAFQRDPRVRPLRMTAEYCYWFGFNHRHPFFQDRRVRRALAQAVDRETMVRTLARGYGRTVNSIIPPQSPLYNASLTGPRYDPAGAKDLLREAGFTPGPDGILQKDGRPFRVRYNFLSEKRYQDVGLVVQQYLREVGVDLTLQPLERGQFFGRYWQPANAPNIEMVGLSYYVLWPVEPLQASLEGAFLSTSQWARNLQYNNPEVDGLLREAASAVETGALRTIYYRLQEVLVNDVAWVVLYRPDELWAVRRRIETPPVHELAQLFDSVARWRMT